MVNEEVIKVQCNIKFYKCKTYSYILKSSTKITLILNIFSLFQPRIAKRCSIPVPMQVVVVIIGTGLSFGLGFNENYKVDVVGEIPQG